MVLETPFSRAEISAFGTMTSGAFLVGEKWIDPFYHHPWKEEEAEDNLLKNLHGDFFCLPFGASPMSHALDEAWGYTPKAAERKEYAHGYSSHGRWQTESQSSSSAELSLFYGQPDIVGVRRRVTLLDNGLVFTDMVETGQETELPVGIHPIFRLPDRTGDALLKLPDCSSVHTYPIDVDISSRFLNGKTLSSCEKIPCKDGTFLNARLLPLPYAQEELLMLANVEEGQVVLENHEEGYAVTLEWDKEKYRHCLLWFSNRGRSFAPWKSRNLCIGIEPVTAPFDLGEGCGRCENPLKRQGIATAYRFKEKSRTILKHSVKVTALG